MISCIHKFDDSGDELVSAIRGQYVARQHVIHAVADSAEELLRTRERILETVEFR